MCHIFFLFSTANKKIMSNESNVAAAPEATSVATVEGATAATSASSWTLESIVQNFKAMPGCLYQGKWLVVTAYDVTSLQSMGIKSLAEALSDADLSAVAVVVGPWLKKRPNVGLPVASYDGLDVYKADKAESYGTNGVYVAFGKRPEKCVADEYLSTSSAESSSSSSRSSSSGGGGGGSALRDGGRCRDLDSFVQLPDEMNDEEADRALLEAADEIVLNGRRRTRQTQAMHDDGMTEMGCGGGQAAKRHSHGRLVSYANRFAELEEKEAKLTANVEKARLQEKSDAKKIKRLSDSAESLKRGMEKVQEKQAAALDAVSRKAAAKLGQATKKLSSLEATTTSGSKKAAKKLEQKTQELESVETELKQKVKEGKRKDREIDHAKSVAAASAKKAAASAKKLVQVRELLEEAAKKLVQDRELLEEAAKKLERERDAARREKRDWKQQAQAYKKSAEAADAKVKRAEGQAAAAEADSAKMAEELGDMVESLDEMTKELLRARALLSDSEKAELDILVQAQEVEEGPSLVGVLGKKDERWSQDVIEIGMELIEKGLSARQAEAVTRAFVHFLYPNLVEGVDYRIPGHQRFKEWRSFLGPVSHYLAVSCIKLAVSAHLLHDATTKDGIGVFQTSARVRLKNDDGTFTIAEFPVKFELLMNGEAGTEVRMGRYKMGGGVMDEWAGGKRVGGLVFIGVR